MSIVSDSAATRAESSSTKPLVTEETACNLCGSSLARRLFTEIYRLRQSEAELGIVRCKRCGLVYVSPRLTFESTQDVYLCDAEQTISHDYCWNDDSNESRFRRLLDRLAELQPEGRLLDVGCGFGHFLAAAKRRSRWEVMGVEPVDSAAAQARQLAQCRVHNGTLDELLSEPGSFDVITMLGVLEHLHDPIATLGRVHELLKPRGILAAYVPNFCYLQIKDTGLVSLFRQGRWSHLHPQEHLFQFTPRSLYMILEAARFQLIDLDIGHPFLHVGGIQRWLKVLAYQGTRMLRKLTGVHLGGLEAIARRVDETDTAGAA